MRKQMLAEAHRLRHLKVRVSGHDDIDIFLCERTEKRDEAAQRYADECLQAQEMTKNVGGTNVQ